jgi:peptide chain release factor 1
MNSAVEKLLSRLSEVEAKLGHASAFEDQRKYRELTQEHAYLSDVKAIWDEFQSSERQLEDNRQMHASETDQEFLQVLRDDNAQLEQRIEKLKVRLEELLIPPDPNDNRNTIIELRAGTGGEEAALFVSDCARMYKLYADQMGWKYEMLSFTPSDMGGCKECVMVFSGPQVHRFMQHESGTHRVQRVPETEAQGRVHTSAITVAVLAEPDEAGEIVIDEKDLRVDTFRSSGAGGQHVNTTDSAVRITHIPTGVVVGCQEERSQHKNKDKAMRLLRAKLADLEVQKQHAQISSDRAEQVGSGDRSERIRTYNFPQNRLTDHRVNLTQYNLDRVMNGDLNSVSLALVAHARQKKIEADR